MNERQEQEARRQAAKDGVTDFSTGVAVVRGGKILVVRRAAHDHLGGKYELPGGSVDPGESFVEGAKRELLEETGLTVTKVIGTFDGFDYETSKKPKVRQVNFAVEVADDPVALDPNEHDDYRWITDADVDALDDTENMQKCLHKAFKAVS